MLLPCSLDGGEKGSCITCAFNEISSQQSLDVSTDGRHRGMHILQLSSYFTSVVYVSMTDV